MKEKYKVIHESHARFLSDSEYRVLLSINMFQNVGKELISIEMIAKDCSLDNNTVDRAILSLSESKKLTWIHFTDTSNKNNQVWNKYSINPSIKKPHPNWYSTKKLVDTRCFKGAPAWACWFIAVMNAMQGFKDKPGNTNYATIAKYCGLDKRTVKKYHQILSVAKEDWRWPPLDHNYIVPSYLLFPEISISAPLIEVCDIPERKKWPKKEE